MHGQSVLAHVARTRERLATLTTRVRPFAGVHGTVMRRQVAGVVEATIALRTFVRPFAGVHAATGAMLQRYRLL